MSKLAFKFKWREGADQDEELRRLRNAMGRHFKTVDALIEHVWGKDAAREAAKPATPDGRSAKRSAKSAASRRSRKAVLSPT